MALFGLIGSTKKLAGQYSHMESATQKNRRKALDKAEAGRPGRLARHWGRDIRKAAEEGQAWEDSQRRYGR